MLLMVIQWNRCLLSTVADLHMKMMADGCRHVQLLQMELHQVNLELDQTSFGNGQIIFEFTAEATNLNGTGASISKHIF